MQASLAQQGNPPHRRAYRPFDAGRVFATPVQTSAQARLPFPALPSSTEVDDVVFWLSAWMRDVAASEALTTFAYTAAAQEARIESKALSLALTVAMCNAMDEIRDSAKNLRDVGGLLFAFTGTTKLQRVPA